MQFSCKLASSFEIVDNHDLHIYMLLLRCHHILYEFCDKFIRNGELFINKHDNDGASRERCMGDKHGTREVKPLW